MSPTHTAVSSLVHCVVSLALVTVSQAQLDGWCNSTASASAGVLFACPQGDGNTLGSVGLTVTVTVRDILNVPVPGIPAEDIWLIGCNNLLGLCDGSQAISATGPTDANGQTTITAAFAAGGCDVGGVRVVVQGVVIGAGVCGQPCLPIKVKSADITGDLRVDLIDLAQFSPGYQSPPKPYIECIDYVAPFGAITLADFARFGSHYQHLC